MGGERVTQQSATTGRRQRPRVHASNDLPCCHAADLRPQSGEPALGGEIGCGGAWRYTYGPSPRLRALAAQLGYARHHPTTTTAHHPPIPRKEAYAPSTVSQGQGVLSHQRSARAMGARPGLSHQRSARARGRGKGHTNDELGHHKLHTTSRLHAHNSATHNLDHINTYDGSASNDRSNAPRQHLPGGTGKTLDKGGHLRSNMVRCCRWSVRGRSRRRHR